MRHSIHTFVQVVLWIAVLVVGSAHGNTGLGQTMVVVACVGILVCAGWAVADDRAARRESRYQAPPRMGPR